MLVIPTATGAIARPGATLALLAVIASFCLMSGATYLIADARDRVRAAATAAFLAAVLALLVSSALAALVLGYGALALGYMLWWRGAGWFDTLAATGGFVARVVAGAAAIQVSLSSSFLVVISVCTLLVAVAKRPPAPPLRPRGRTSRRSLRVRMRRIVALTVAMLLTYVTVSFGSAMSAPSNSPFGVRAVEWLRDNGAAWLVSDVEAMYYSANAPSTGGPRLKALPRVGVAAAQVKRGYSPPPIVPIIHPALPGEGRWHGTGPLVRGAPPVLATTFRPDPDYPQMVAGVAWIDSSRTWLDLYPGRYEPPGVSGAPAEVPLGLRASLLATFNSGFKLEDDDGGFVVSGHVFSPLRDGQATLLRYRNGAVDIVTWTGGPAPGPSVEVARQNLPLIVDRGQLNPNLSDGPQWGATLGNAIRVWRSGIGIDAHGNILYAAADAQTAQSLAQILQRAGAVRAMELDINSEWVTFNFYGTWNAGMPEKLLPDMTREPTRYLTPDDRDFFAVFARRGS